MPDVASLSQAEAMQRAALLSVTRYEIDVDMRGLLEGEVIESKSLISFTCTEPGGSTFVDCTGQVTSAVLNGTDLDLSTIERGRIPLTDLAADNVLVVTARQSDTSTSQGIQRTVDPSDKLVYVWTSFECDDARRIWACFDQPDLKAPHRFVVTAPESWTITSNMHADDVAEADDGGRVWTFPDTPPLSTYVVVVNGGPFHEIREQRGDHSLGLYCRQSLKQFMERDAQFILDVTEQGLAWFGEQFDQPFPEAHYDQVFVPNMGGAMENWGCITWTDSVLWRTDPSYSQRWSVASVTLHEMAHMWFGDLVTMQWWDDLWLNEAFASWASTWAAAEATDFTDAWAEFLVGRKLDAYRTDMGPATHPIRNEVPDVAAALANFDAITYAKGQSVLHQLMAYVGEDAFTRGLQDYFARHAWGNTRLVDLMSAVSRASGRDLDAWTVDWLDRSGTDTVTVDGDQVLVEAPDGGQPRPHRLDVGFYAESGALLERISVETSGARTTLEGVPAQGLALPNDTDLGFVASRTADDSLRRLLTAGGGLPDASARAVAVATSLDMLRKGELAASDALDCVLGVVGVEKNPALIDPFLGQANAIAELWTPADQVDAARTRVADQALALIGDADLRLGALHVLAATASSEAHEAALDEAAADDIDLAWRVAVRRAELGRHDEAHVADLLARDPDPDSAARAVAVTAARPETEAKEEAWRQLFELRSIQAGYPTFAVARAFWRPGQDELLAPYADRYLDEMLRFHGGLLSMLSLVRGMFPTFAEASFADRAREVAERPATDPTVRGQLLLGADTLDRMLKARG